jgi:hypothetical protein
MVLHQNESFIHVENINNRWTSFLSSFFCSYTSFGLSLALPLFFFLVMVPTIELLLDFGEVLKVHMLKGVDVLVMI